LKNLKNSFFIQFRVNSLKIDENSLFSRFQNHSSKEINNHLFKTSSFLDKKIYQTDIKLGKSIEHSLGLIYLQSFSSMIPAFVLNPGENDKILDLCSAPGSKTTLIAELMNNKGFILANEISIDRIKMLASNIDRLGITNTAISNMNGGLISKYFINYFDKVLIDPPCSALGSHQASSTWRLERNLKRLDRLTEIQFRLLVAAAKVLKIGGELVYSTCTTTLEENELLISKFVNKYPFEVVDTKLSDLFGKNLTGRKISSELSKTLRLDPDAVKSEGFFIAKLKKVDDIKDESPAPMNFNSKIQVRSSANIIILNALESLSENYGIDKSLWEQYQYYQNADDIYFISKTDFDFTTIPLHRIGLKLTSFDKKTGWRLSTNAAQILTKHISKNIVELSRKEDLISYYMGHKTKVDHADSDFVVVKYDGLIFGSGKIKNRILFSYFPKGRRMNEVDFDSLR
ncbi:MAG: NOL1/NOP2/sun family putative RNA methylase, partial [Bacteroidetes bacterium]|nr:NOL1/NOP2/sun family putative RNA methylase [Bacteroidota bacterium]